MEARDGEEREGEDDFDEEIEGSRIVCGPGICECCSPLVTISSCVIRDGRQNPTAGLEYRYSNTVMRLTVLFLR